MRKLNLRLNIWYFIFLLPFLSFSQDEEFQNWYNLELDYNLTKQIQFTLEGAGRQSNDFYFFIGDQPKNTHKIFFDASIKKKHNNFLSYSLGYRHLFLNNMYDATHSFIYNVVNNFKIKHRMYIDVFFNKKIITNLKIHSRIRYQKQASLELLDDQRTVEIVDKLREKIKLEYSLKKNLDLFFSFELFYHLEQNFEKIRYATGFKKAFGKTSINLSYMLQQQLNDQATDIVMAIRTKLSYSI